MFRALIRVNGVGPKLALAILSGMDEMAFMRCVMEEDAKSLMRLPGVGKKTAERLIIEMRDRFPHWEHPGAVDAAGGSAEPLTSGGGKDVLLDAEAALVSLGYKPAEAAKMLSGLDAGLSTEALIKAALTKQMAN